MDYEHICKQEGYRLEDLKPEDRRTMQDIYFLIEQMEIVKEHVVDSCTIMRHSGSELLDTMLQQFANSFYDEFMRYLVIQAQGLQISMAECE